jgi:uncharacterized protein (UPF0210 family)
MPEVQTITQNQADTRINIHQANELAYWSEKLGVSIINLKIAVSETNGMAKNVEEWLKMKKYIK